MKHVRTKCVLFFFFNDTATTEIYTLSLHDALPIWLMPALYECLQTLLLFKRRALYPTAGRCILSQKPVHVALTHRYEANAASDAPGFTRSAFHELFVVDLRKAAP